MRFSMCGVKRYLGALSIGFVLAVSFSPSSVRAEQSAEQALADDLNGARADIIALVPEWEKVLDVFPSQVQGPVAAFIRDMFDVLGREGSHAVILDFLRARALEEQVRNYRQLGEAVYKATGGKGARIPVQVHPSYKPAVDLLNDHLSRTYGWIQLEPTFDDQLRSPETPLVGNEGTYKIARYGATAFVPTYAATAVFAESGYLALQGDEGTGKATEGANQLAPTAARSIVTFALEVQFKLFTAQWATVFSDDRPMTKKLIPFLPVDRLKGDSKKLRAVFTALNQVIDKTNRISKGLRNNLLVNWDFGFMMATTTLVTLGIMQDWRSLGDIGFWQSMRSVGIGGTFFFASFGLNQVIEGERRNQGARDELQRLGQELGAFVPTAVGRALSFSNLLTSAGHLINALFIATVTGPKLAYTWGLGPYSDKTRAILEAGGSVEKAKPLPICQRILAKVPEIAKVLPGWWIGVPRLSPKAVKLKPVQTSAGPTGQEYFGSE